MNNFYKTLSIFALSVLISLNSKAQCTYIIPADVHVISNDTSINNSFIPTDKFLICPTVTLTVYGNSTANNKFYLESGATIIFSDSMGATPYGMFKIYLKSGAALHYNASSNVSFPFLDTLVWEPGAILIDTGSLFYDTTICNPLVFDYSLIGGTPCGTLFSNNISEQNSYNIFPNPFIDHLNMSFQNSVVKNSEMIIYNFLGEELEHFYLNNAITSEINMKNTWSGIAILEIRNKNGEIHFEKIIRQ
ncbi:hypothetical protein LBMAG27_14210 [Bacteroidota bacterium]|nr:hypothetical protein LBMAG27_14210 [Bacteroidota bacterium]